MDKKILVYEPAMCCSTGVCGPTVDPELVKFAADVEWYKSQGVEVVRYNLSSNTQAFVENKDIKKILLEEGTDKLPVVIINGKIFEKGKYPGRNVIAKELGLNFETTK